MPGARLKITHLVIAIVVLGTTAVTLLVTATPQLVYGATCTWNGSGADSNWSNSDNWDGCAAPGAGDIVVFPSGAVSNYAYNDLGTIALSNLQITGTGYTIAGNTIQITNAFEVSGDVTMDAPVDFVGDGTLLSVDSDPAQVNFEASVNIDAYDVIFGVNGAAVLSPSAQLIGTGDSTLSMTGSGYLTFRADSSATFFGLVDMSAGHLQVEHPSALGDATAVTNVSGGVVELAYGGPIYEDFVLTGGLLSAFANDAELTGVLTVNGPTAFVGDAYGPLIISGEIAGASDYYTYGTVNITGTSTNSGRMELCCIAGNILTVTGSLSSTVMIQSGPDLITGNGSIGSLDFRAGELRPGLNDPGTFTINDSFDASTNVGDATYFVEIHGDTPGIGYDQVIVGGAAVFLSGNVTLDVTLSYGVTLGEEFMIIDNQGGNPTSGTFAGLSEGEYFLVSGNYFKVNYNAGDGNDVVLTRENPPNNPTTIDVATVTSPVNEGGQTSLHIEFSDADVLDTHDVYIVWQDGVITSETLAAGVTTFDVNHTYANNGSYNVDIQVGDLGGVDNVFRMVTVNNVAPTLSGLNISGTGANKTISGNITDPGVLDTFTININWNDGTGIQSINRPAGATSFTADRTISGTGNFTVNVTITDNAGGNNAYSLVTSVSASSSTTTSGGGTTTTSAPATTTVPVVIPVATPTGGVILVNNKPEFTWTIPTEITYSKVSIYIVQLTDGDGNTLVPESEVDEETIRDSKYLLTNISDQAVTTYTPPQGLILGSYRWAVVAEDDDGEPVATSSVSEFRIASEEQVNDIEDGNGVTTSGSGSELPQEGQTYGTFTFLGVDIPPQTQEVIVNTPAVPAAAAVASAAVVAAVASNNMLGVVVGLFLPRRRKHWGVIYNEEENKPVAFGSVKLSKDGQLVNQGVSDLSGKYGFLVERPGNYQIAAEVSGYKPTNVDVKVDSDLAAFADISLAKGAVTKDKLRQFITENRQRLFTVVRWVLGLLMVFGLVYTYIAFSISPTVINIILLGVYFVLSLPGIVIVVRNIFSRSNGKVVDAETHRGLGGVSVRLQNDQNATVMAFTNLNGELKVNFPQGIYQAFITKPGFELVGGETTAGGVKMMEVSVGEDGKIKERIRMRKQAADKAVSGDGLNTPFGV